jgi:hypothetical protein
MPYPCALSIPYSTSLILCVHWIRRLESRGAVYRCPVRRAHGTYTTRGKPPSGPRASAPLISSPGSRSGGPARWGVWRARLRSYAPTGTQKLGVKRESRAAACARCAARGACVRGTVAARPLCGSYSSCRRLSSTYDSWHRIYVCTKGIRSKNGGLPLMLTVILLSSIRAGPLLNHVLRSSIVVRGTCDRNISVYDAVLRTLLAYATQGNHNPCRTECWHWLS